MGNNDLLLLLLRMGANPNHTDLSTQISHNEVAIHLELPLQQSVILDNIETAQILLEYGANPNSSTAWKRIPAPLRMNHQSVLIGRPNELFDFTFHQNTFRLEPDTELCSHSTVEVIYSHNPCIRPRTPLQLAVIHSVDHIV